MLNHFNHNSTFLIHSEKISGMKTVLKFFLALVFFLVSCKRDANKLDSIGPNYVTTEEEFSISSNPANFTSDGSVHFTAKLTVSSSWKIEIRGSKSGAIKRFSGTSQFIDLSNTEWDGSSDTTVKFRSEACVAKLYIPASGVIKKINFNSYIGPFSITQNFAINVSPVNFSSSIYFTGEFNRSKDWTITITGATSGASKTITGSSNVLSSSNAAWDGSSDALFFFRAESCQAVLSFPDTSLTQTINFTINSPKNHGGYLINDFEASAFGTYLGSYNGNFFDAADQATSIINLFTFSPSIQGNKVVRFDCHDVNSSYYTGGIYHNSVGSNYGIPVLDNDSLRLNFFVYGYAGGNAALSVEISENDGDKWQPTQIAVNWTGWKLVSIQYSQMANNSGTGNITRESNKINAVNVSMNSIPAGQNCKALIDYIIFSDGVFKP
jgi:uncharacterized membrane protein YciS (DUF1049 family)